MKETWAKVTFEAKVQTKSMDGLSGLCEDITDVIRTMLNISGFVEDYGYVFHTEEPIKEESSKDMPEV